MFGLLGINGYILAAKPLSSKSEWTDQFIKQTAINIMHIWMDAYVYINMHICMHAQLTSHRISSVPVLSTGLPPQKAELYQSFRVDFFLFCWIHIEIFTVVTEKRSNLEKYIRLINLEC